MAGRGASRAGRFWLVGVALVLLVVGLVLAVRAVTSDGGSAAASPPEVAASGQVVASASCLAPDAHDTVAVDLGGLRREVRLDACGSRVGSRVDVLVAADGSLARVAGTGAGAGSDTADPGTSPAVTALSIVLFLVAAVAGGALLVAVGRERRGTRTPAGVDLPRPRRSPVTLRPDRSEPRRSAGWDARG